MQDLLTFLVTEIVNHPDEVEISQETNEGSYITLNIKVHDEDTGLVIGKKGRTIKALETLVRLKAMKENKRVSLNLLNDRVETTPLYED